MIIKKFESWWVERGKCLFDEKRQGGAKMGWDVLVIKLTTDTGLMWMPVWKRSGKYLRI